MAPKLRIYPSMQGFSIDLSPESPYLGAHLWERVAQPVEHLTFNQRVLGSSPSALTIYPRDLPFVQPSGRLRTSILVIT
jgi:hypothetical protein